MRKDAELRVLRHLAGDADDFVVDGLEEFEVYAALDRLERMNYLKVFWDEGHVPVAYHLLYEGRVWLKELEMEEKGEQDEIERLRQENTELRTTVEKLQARIEELTGNGQRSYDKQAAIQELKYIFMDREQTVNEFLSRIEGLKPIQVTTVVNLYIKDALINTEVSSRSLHTILKKYGLYGRGYTTWNSQVKWPKKKNK